MHTSLTSLTSLTSDTADIASGSLTSDLHPDAGRPHPAGAAGGPAKRWATAGWVAGLLGFATFLGPASALIVPTDDLDDNAKLVEHLDGLQGWIWAFQTSTFLLAVLVVVFGLGLRRRLAGQAPTGSILPDVAAAGMLLVAGLLLVGGGIGTEMFHSVRNIHDVDPDTLATQLTVYNTLAWVWAGGILTTGAIAVAGLRHGSVSRGLGRFAAVMTGLIALTQVLPFQYLAVAPVALFLIVTGIALQREIGRVGQ
jgi:hypothetical protein